MDVTMMTEREDLECLSRTISLQDSIYLLIGHPGEIGRRPLFDLLALATEFTRKNGGRRMSVGDDVDIHERIVRETIWNVAGQKDYAWVHNNPLPTYSPSSRLM